MENTDRLSHIPHEHGAASRRGNGSNDNQQSSVLDHSHFDSPSLYDLTATDHYTRLDAELVADMEGKPFGFGYLNQNVFVGGFDEFSPGGWEAPSQRLPGYCSLLRKKTHEHEGICMQGIWLPSSVCVHGQVPPTCVGLGIRFLHHVVWLVALLFRGWSDMLCSE